MPNKGTRATFRSLPFTRIGAVTLAALLVFAASTGLQLVSATPSPGLLPDLQTVVPSQLQVTGAKGTTPAFLLRFTNAIGNLGAGVLQMRNVSDATTTYGYQEVLNASGAVTQSILASTFAFHPAHNHWHIDAVADYSLRSGSVTGPVVVQTTKVTFCMIDVERILGKAASGPRHYVGCNAVLQGITNGWADEYVRSLPGQELVITGLAAGLYYLVSTSDPLNKFLESNDANNVAWVSFQLSYSGTTPAVTEVSHSPCEGVMCGNRTVSGFPK